MSSVSQNCLRGLRLVVGAHVRLIVIASVVAMAAGCPGVDSGGVDAGPEEQVTGCEKHAECGEGFVCAGGQCLVGECVAAVQDLCLSADADPVEVAPFCCKPWQFCNGLDRTCQYREDFVGSQCEVDADCPDIGQFCSGANCYESAGRDPCTANFQCAGDERCDREISLCVPDLGGCNFCSDTFPELCCEEGAACDVETSFCVNILGSECSPETEEFDCLPNQTCDPFGRCVQCLTSDDCGPGTACNTGTGRCYSILGLCEDDGDCTGNKVCSPDNECIVAECTTNGPCIAEDSRQLCDLNTFTCYLPPATCTENDEPNDTVATATPFTLAGGAGTLCRGDTDYLSFPVLPGMRYRVTVQFPTTNVGGNDIAIVRSNGTSIDNDSFQTWEDDLTLVAVTGENDEAFLYLKITGSGGGADTWAYSISFEETEAPNAVTCDEENALGIEPNNSFQTAYEIAPGAFTFARCTDEDRDYYHVVLPPQSGIEVISEHENSDGDLELELYSAPLSTSQVARQDTTSGVERVEGPEASEYWIQVGLYSDFTTGTDGQPYTLTVLAKPRPETCATDPGEPGDDTIATAPTLASGTSLMSKHCVPADVDHRLLVVPAGMSGAVNATFTHSQGDLRLDLLSATGDLISSSNTSSAAVGAESVEIPVVGAETTYVIRVRLNGGTSAVGQTYTLSADLYDATVCLESEPVANGTLKDGRCLGTVTSPYACNTTSWSMPLSGQTDLEVCELTPSTEGCATLCGASDNDYYRVGTLTGGQLLQATLRYDTSSGRRMGLALTRGSADLSTDTWVAYEPDSMTTGVSTVMVIAPNVPAAFEREYGVLVRSESPTTYPAIGYSLDVLVGEPCLVDPFEPNETAGQSGLLRTDGAPGVAYTEDLDGSLCVNDVDVYELLAFQSETVTVTMLAPEGLSMSIGSRPANLNDLPVSESAATVVSGPCPIATPPEGGPTNPVCLTATLDVATLFQQVYVTVTRDSDDLLTTTEPYIVRVNAQD